MTAKSRRRKIDKRRKSDERPQPRHREAAARREESKRDHPAGKGLQADYVQTNDWEVAFDEECEKQGIVPLNVIEPSDYDIIINSPPGAKLYLNDFEKKVLEEAQRDFDQKRGIGSKVVRTSGSSHGEAAS